MSDAMERILVGTRSHFEAEVEQAFRIILGIPAFLDTGQGAESSRLPLTVIINRLNRLELEIWT